MDMIERCSSLMLFIMSKFSLLLDRFMGMGLIKSPSLMEAFRTIDRADFVPRTEKGLAYENAPLPIGYGQTISQPYTVAFMLGLLDPQEWDIVLDIGSGSGWTTALLGHVVGKTGYVTGVEIIPELVTMGQNNLKKYSHLHAIIVQAKEGVLGIPGNTFDKILVSASASTFPSELLDQLKPNGRLIIPVGNSIFLYQKDDVWNVYHREFPGFAFVPLHETR